VVQQYFSRLSDVKIAPHAIVDFYLKAREQAVSNLRDGSNQRPHYSLRTLCRALTQAQAIAPVYGAHRALYEGFCMSFLTQLDMRSHAVIYSMLKNIFGFKSTTFTPPPQPGRDFVDVSGFWLRTGALAPEVPDDYIMTTSIQENMLNVARIVVSHKYPVLLQGPTSCGKTSLIEYLV
jgi:midasin (ATPase involved in ribosome maturation)